MITDPATDVLDDESDLDLSTVLSYFAIGFLFAVYVRSLCSTSTDPLDDVRQRVATLEGKCSR